MTVIGEIVMGNYFSYMRISTKEERGKQKYTRQENSLERYARNQGIDYVIQFTKKVPVPAKKYGRAETIYLIDQEAQSAAFLEVNVKGFLKKGGEKIKMESQKPCKYRLRDSERL